MGMAARGCEVRVRAIMDCRQLVLTVEQPWAYIQEPQNRTLKQVHFMLRELYLNKAPGRAGEWLRVERGLAGHGPRLKPQAPPLDPDH